MTLNIKSKQAIVTEVRKVAEAALSAVVADSRGITANKMTELRKTGRELNVYVRVIRNTLLRRIVKGTQFECLKDTFVGPTLIAYSMEHPSAAVRLFKAFEKTNIKKFQIRVAAFENKLLQESKIDWLENLPTYEEIVTRLIVTMKEASAGRLVQTLTAVRSMKETF